VDDFSKIFDASESKFNCTGGFWVIQFCVLIIVTHVSMVTGLQDMGAMVI